MRILVAFEYNFRAYRETIAAAIRVLRPGVEVETTSLDALGEHIERFDPHLVICSQSNTIYAGSRLAWVELSLDPLHPSKICVGGRYSERTNPTLGMLLEVIDEVKVVIQTNNDFRGC
jgi:hypothetical protein